MRLTVLPLREMDFNLTKWEFPDAIKLCYDWPVDDIPSTGVCGEIFTVDHATICKPGRFVIQRHNELRDLEAEPLNVVHVCSDVKVEPSRGANLHCNTRLMVGYSHTWFLGTLTIGFL